MMLVVRVGIVIPGVGELFGGFVFFVKMPLLGGGLKGVCSPCILYFGDLDWILGDSEWLCMAWSFLVWHYYIGRGF
jgi:hypothetical protein